MAADVTSNGIMTPKRALLLGTAAAFIGAASFFCARIPSNTKEYGVGPMTTLRANGPTHQTNDAQVNRTAPVKSMPASIVERRSVSPAFPRAYEFTPTQPVESGPVLPLFNQLKVLADAGDAHAGFRLFDETWRCIVLQYQEVNDARDVEKAERNLGDCDGVGAVEIAEAYRQLERSAERGDVEAQLVYAEVAYRQYPTAELILEHPEFPSHYRRNYLRFLEATVAGGSVRGIETLADGYRAGQSVNADPFKAYAYEYAVTLLQPDWARGNLDWSARSLTPEQIASAQRLAAQILARCCK